MMMLCLEMINKEALYIYFTNIYLLFILQLFILQFIYFTIIYLQYIYLFYNELQQPHWHSFLSP